MESNVIEDCHIQTTDSSYGDWLIQQGILTSDNVMVEPSVTHGTQNTYESDIHKIMQKEDVTIGS